MHCKRRRSLTIIMLNYQLSAKVCLCVKPRPVLGGLWCSTTEGRAAKSTRSLWRSCPGSGLGWWVPWLMWIQGEGLGISFIRWTIAPKVDCSASHSVCDQLFLMRSDKLGPPYCKRKTSGGSKGCWCSHNNLNFCRRFPTFAMFKVGGGMEVHMISGLTQLLLSWLLWSVIFILCRSTMESLDFRRSPHLQGVFLLLWHFRRKGKNNKMFAFSRLANQAHTMKTLTGEDFPDILRCKYLFVCNKSWNICKFNQLRLWLL